jgi:hypothetical protein
VLSYRLQYAKVRIRRFAHKGLKRLYTEDSVKGVSPETADKLRKMLAFLMTCKTRMNCVLSQCGRLTS